MFLSDLNVKEQEDSTWVSLRRFKDRYGIIAEVDIYDKNTFFVHRTVCKHFRHKSQHIAYQTLPKVEEKKVSFIIWLRNVLLQEWIE